MIGVLLAVGAQVVVKPAEVWEPRVSWGCVVSKEGEKPFVLNGIIAQRNEPNNPNVHQRFERALRVVRDDSGAFAGKQARSPMFVVHPKQYWAFFKGQGGQAFSSANPSLILTKDGAGRPTKIDLFDGGSKSTKPYASGQCISRVLSSEIVQ